MAFLDRFDAVLFDLNGTLAVGYDRFGPEQDFHATYRALGGRQFAPEVLDRIIRQSWDRCLARYASGPYDHFPAFRDFLPDLDDDARDKVEETVAIHETGSIPRSRIEWLTLVAGTHRLGIVSDQWAPSGRLRSYLQSCGVAALMSAIVLSCEEGAVKPSRSLFLKALEKTRTAPDRTLYVGDSYRRDVVGAAGCGMATAWISETGQAVGPVRPTRILTSVEALATLE